MPPSGREISELHELARLEAQLDALEQDIRHARALADQSARGRLDVHGRAQTAHTRSGGERVRLRDGADILIRPIERGDADQLKLEFEHLGALSRYRGFLAPIEHLSDEQLRRLTDVDHVTHEALVALDAARAEVVGIARYVQAPGDPQEARVIVVVADAWQQRGAGTALVERLAARAHAAGVERFKARMIVGETPARRLLEHIGSPLAERSEGGITEITIALADRR